MTRLLIRDEKEKLVLLHRPAEDPRHIGLNSRPPWLAVITAEPVVGVEVGIAKEFKCGAVKPVCAGFSNYVYVGAWVAPISRIVTLRKSES